MRRLKELFGMAIIGGLIGLVAVALVVACACLLPVRWMMDGSRT